MLYISQYVHIQYRTCIHRAGKHVHIRLFDSEGTEIPDTCPDPEKSLNLQSTCSWDANMVSCTWGQEDMLCYYKAFFSFPSCPGLLCLSAHTPQKSCPRRASTVVGIVVPKTSSTISISISPSTISPLSSACLTGGHNHLINIYPTENQL